MTKEEFQELLDKHLKGESSEQEAQLIESISEKFISNAEESVFSSPLEKERVRKELLAKIKPRRTFAIPLWRVAASLLLLFGFGYLIWQNFIQEETLVHSTGSGELKELTLSDGTMVQLAPESSIEFPKEFSQTERLIRLTGQAFFKVAHDSLHPFIVKSNGAQVQVLGTEFDLSSYLEDSSITVSLIKGSVKVSKEGEFRILEPGQQALMPIGGRGLTVTNFNPEHALNWTKNRLSFQSSKLWQVAHSLKRKFGISIEFAKPEIAQFTISAHFKEANLTEILNAICKAKNLEFQKTDSGVYLIYGATK